MTIKYKSVLVISDLHIPYHHPQAFDFLQALKTKYKPDHIVNIGDELDAMQCLCMTQTQISIQQVMN
jgi:predicted phosphodiesterase